MVKCLPLITLLFLSQATARAQDITPTDSIKWLLVPQTMPLPAGITLFNSGVALLPANRMVFDLRDYPAYNRPLIPNLQTWQKDFVRRNGLDGLSPNNGTLADGLIMAHALFDRSQANHEFYHNNVLMNQRMVGNTQLQRMNVRMRTIRYVDFIGAGRLGIITIMNEALPEGLPAGLRLGNEKRK